MARESKFFPNKHSEFKFPLKIFLSLVFLSLVMIGVVAYYFNVGYEMSVKFSPLVDAAMEIKLETTIAHLWFEEMISNDASIKIEQVMKHIDNAIWYSNAMLEGGENSEGVFVPLVDPILRVYVKEVLQKIYVFRDTTTERFKTVATSGIGTPIDQGYDANFLNILEEADFLETKIQEFIRSGLKKYRMLQWLLISSLILLSTIHLIIFYVYEKQRTKNLASIREKYAQVKSLRGLIPVCALCKNVRDDEGFWTKFDDYLQKNSAAEIKHIICQECLNKFDH